MGGYQLEDKVSWMPCRRSPPVVRCGPFPHQQHLVVLRIARRIAYGASHHFSEEIELEAVARSIGVSAEWLDICFDHCRGKTPFQTLQHIRLSRLFEGIASQPHSTLKQQVHRCGLASVMAANRLFEELFGIGLAPFRRVCRQAEADRQLRQWSC
jgi:AraC-like DNA-binding protein